MLHALIVDDDPSFRHLAEIKLKSFLPELEIKTASSLKQAREILNVQPRTQFDLVMLDQHIGDGKGTDLLSEGWFEGLAVVSVSSDTSPDLPGAHIQAGAAYFLSKRQITEALFAPLVRGIIDRNRLRRELAEAEREKNQVTTVRTLIATLKHEINNPLGAVLGAAFLIRSGSDASPEQRDNAVLVEQSAKRIKHVLEQLAAAVALSPVDKANHQVFHIPGDDKWEK